MKKTNDVTTNFIVHRPKRLSVSTRDFLTVAFIQNLGFYTKFRLKAGLSVPGLRDQRPWSENPSPKTLAQWPRDLWKRALASIL